LLGVEPGLDLRQDRRAAGLPCGADDFVALVRRQTRVLLLASFDAGKTKGTRIFDAS